MDTETILDDVSKKYDEFFESREQAGLVKTGDETPTELHRKQIQEGHGNVFNISTEEDKMYLVVFSDELPAIHEMPYEFLRQYPIELTRLMRITPISLDHKYYWAWTIQILSTLNREEEIFELQLSQSIESLIQLLLSMSSPLKDRERLDRIAEMSMTKHLKAVSNKSLQIAAFNSYPVLEGLLKRVSADVIKPNGEIREGERLHGLHHEYPEGETCSVLRDLLYHTENNAVNSELQSNLQDMRDQIDLFGDEDHAYELIDNWRNSLLHGQATYDIQAGIIVNLISIFVWNEIDKSDYEDKKGEILSNIRHSQRMPDVGHNTNIYPPE